MSKVSTIGNLLYNAANERFGIWDAKNKSWLNDGFHCGDKLEVKINGTWVPTSVEMRWPGAVWFFTGIADCKGFEGKVVRQSMER